MLQRSAVFCVDPEIELNNHGENSFVPACLWLDFYKNRKETLPVNVFTNNTTSTIQTTNIQTALQI